MGDVVEVGRHRLLCGDITDGAVTKLMGNERADVVYSDPPWGPGNQQYWHTMRERGAAPRTSWHAFVEAFAAICSDVSRAEAPVFVEMGMRWADELTDVMAAHGLYLARRWVMTYGPKSKPLPVTLNLYGRESAGAALGVLAGAVSAGMPDPPHGEPVTAHVLGLVVSPGSVVLDPCTGLGMTARWTHKLGGSFRGTEMNAARLARTETWLRAKADR